MHADAKNLGKIAARVKATAQTDLQNAQLRIGQQLGGLVHPVRGQVLDWRLFDQLFNGFFNH